MLLFSLKRFSLLSFPLFTIPLVFILVLGCKKQDSPRFFSSWNRPSNPVTIVREQPDTLSFPLPLIHITVPDTNALVRYITIRDGDNNVPTVVVGAVGTPVQQLPADLQRILTQGNRRLQDYVAGDTVAGWSVQEIMFLRRDGNTENVSNFLADSVAQALSFTLTLFNNGYYILFSHTNQDKYNQAGWYQVAMREGLPIGLLYQSVVSGKNFDRGPLNDAPVQGMGIWGITEERFFPVVPLSKFTDARDVIIELRAVRYVLR